MLSGRACGVFVGEMPHDICSVCVFVAFLVGVHSIFVPIHSRCLLISFVICSKYYAIYMF